MSPSSNVRPLSPVVRRLWVAVGGMALFVATFVVMNARQPEGRALRAADLGHDFLAFYAAGTFARDGRFADLYDMAAVREFQFGAAREIGLALGPGFMPWWNPPFAALPIVPLAGLPYRTALVAWLAINVACVAAACGLLVRAVRGDGVAGGGGAPVGWRTWALVPAAVVVSTPFILSLTHGQNTGVSLLLLSAVVTFWRGGRPWLAGVACGLMFYKPQLAACVAVALWVRLGWRAAAGVAAAGAGLLVVTLAMMPGALDAFLHRMPANLTAFQEAGPYYWERHVTFKALWRLLIQGHEAGPTAPAVVALWAASTLALGAALARVLWRDRLPSRRETPVFEAKRMARMLGAVSTGDPGLRQAAQAPASFGSGARLSWHEDRAIAATIACSPLLMPFYFDYDLLLMAIPVALYAAARLRAESAPTRLDRWTTVAWCGLAGWMLVHPHVAAATNVNGNAIAMALCAGLAAAAGWGRKASECAEPAFGDEAGRATLAA